LMLDATGSRGRTIDRTRPAHVGKYTYTWPTVAPTRSRSIPQVVGLLDTHIPWTGAHYDATFAFRTNSLRRCKPLQQIM